MACRSLQGRHIFAFVPSPLSLVFTKGTTAVVILFFTASIAFFVYRHNHAPKIAAAIAAKDSSKQAKKAIETEPRLWKFYFEDSVAPSGKYIYLERPVDTVKSANAVYELLQDAGKIPASDSPSIQD